MKPIILSNQKGTKNQTIYTTGTEFNRIIDLDEIKFIQIGDKILDGI
jgi:predicted nucleic-acid-binding Zn-ribbon protein